jgi:hypothetical protein
VTRLQCENRYGAIDFSTGYWPEKRQWLTMLEIPVNWFPNWYVLDSKMPVKRIACNVDMKDNLYAALEQVSQLDPKALQTFDGCFEIRLVRGSKTNFSAHSYGLAVDLNAHDNPLGVSTGGFYETPSVVDCFRKNGFTWGGDFQHRKDPMHFTFCGF